VLIRWLAATSIAVALLCTTSPSPANGRFPKAQAIASVPGEGGRTLFLRTTFGILISKDAGAHWRWICERALGYDGTWDPPIAATRDGRLWVGLESGLVSTVDGCRVDASPELEGYVVKDLTTDARGEAVFAITSAAGKKGYVWRRAPGERFVRLGAGLEDMNLMTLEVAPSRASRVYVSGQPYATVRGQLFRSDDGGKTLKGTAGTFEAEGPFFIAGIDPEDPDRVLLRHLHARGSDLLVTADGGKTFSNVLSMKSAMFGFAKSEDGATYWAASGVAEDGVLRSDDRGKTFTKIADHGVLCLHAASADHLFACENPFSLGSQAVSVSSDRGATFRGLAAFGDVEGPVLCAGAGDRGDGHPDASAGLVPLRDGGASLCAGDAWDETRAFVTPPPPAASTPAPATTGGGAGAHGEGSAPRSRCGCRLPGASRTSPDLAWLMVGLLPLIVRARGRGARGSRDARMDRHRLGGPTGA
jgi:hypothetical protein